MFTKSDIKNVLYLGLGFVVLRNISDIVGGISDKITPDAPTPQEKEIKAIEKGKIPLTKKGNGANLKRVDSDTYLQQRVDKLKEGFLQNNQSLIINALIPVKTDADYSRMSELFGEKWYTKFTVGKIGFYNMSSGLNAFANASTKARINQSWEINKKYPNQITFKL
jgi:hypothetical protein